MGGEPSHEMNPPRTCIVTGGNAGIGRVTATELARHYDHVLLSCRSAERARPVVEAIRAETGNLGVDFVPLDLASLASVRRAAEQILARDQPIQLLVNNAGLASIKGQTADGFEMTFGVNHLGHFLLTTLLLDRIVASAPARIVNVSSTGHYHARGIDFDHLRSATRSPTGIPEYQVSKLANVLFSAELARRLEGTGVTTYSLHPGVIASEIWKPVPGPLRWLIKRFMITEEEGARTTLHCALSEEAGAQTGLYYDRCAPKEPNPLAHDEALAAELWERSEAWTRPP